MLQTSVATGGKPCVLLYPISQKRVVRVQELRETAGCIMFQSPVWYGMVEPRTRRVDK